MQGLFVRQLVFDLVFVIENITLLIIALSSKSITISTSGISTLQPSEHFSCSENFFPGEQTRVRDRFPRLLFRRAHPQGAGAVVI